MSNDTPTIRVMVVDDEDLVRAAVAGLLTADTSLTVSASCRNATEALQALRTTATDVIVVDSQLGMQQGIDLIAACREAGYKGQIVLLGSELTDGNALTALRNGATG